MWLASRKAMTLGSVGHEARVQVELKGRGPWCVPSSESELEVTLCHLSPS